MSCRCTNWFFTFFTFKSPKTPLPLLPTHSALPLPTLANIYITLLYMSINVNVNMRRFAFVRQ